MEQTFYIIQLFSETFLKIQTLTKCIYENIAHYVRLYLP